MDCVVFREGGWKDKDCGWEGTQVTSALSVTLHFLTYDKMLPFAHLGGGSDWVSYYPATFVIFSDEKHEH